MIGIILPANCFDICILPYALYKAFGLYDIPLFYHLYVISFFFSLIILLIVGFGVIGVIIISLNSFSNDNAFTISYVHKYLYKNI